MAPFKQTTLPAHYRGDQTFGRPSLYRPEYAELVIEDMAQGYSLTAFAGKIRVSVDTVYEWIKRHADFSEAVNRARPARTRAYETKLLGAASGAQAASAIFGLKNCCPDEWKEVRNVTHDVNVKVDTLSDAQLYAIASQKAGANGTVIDGEYSRTDTD
jgi:terminase small subunit-like protein